MSEVIDRHLQEEEVKQTPSIEPQPPIERTSTMNAQLDGLSGIDGPRIDPGTTITRRRIVRTPIRIIEYYDSDKSWIKSRSNKMSATLNALNELVSFKRIWKRTVGPHGEEVWIEDKTLSEEEFWEEEGWEQFFFLVTLLTSQSQGMSGALNWRDGVPANNGTGNGNGGGNGNSNGNGEASLREKIVALPGQLASGAFRVLAPPPIMARPEDTVLSFTDLQKYYSRLQSKVTTGWGKAVFNRKKLAKRVAQTVGWLQSHSDGRAIEQVTQIDRISSGVFKELT